MTYGATVHDLGAARRALTLSRVFYVSRATTESGHEIQDIVRVSRSRNAGIDVTGVLAFSGEHFAQVLEGAQANLEALMRSIGRDYRHEILWTWPVATVAARWYPYWAMGYLYHDDLEVLVARLSQAPTLPALEDFVRDLFRGAEINRRSLT